MVSTGRVARALGVYALLLTMTPGCTIQQLTEPTREQILRGILPSSVQIVLELGGQRFRTGSGVVIAARPVSQGGECFVLTSGHTFTRLSGLEAIYVLLDRHRGEGRKAPAAVLAQRENDEIDLALLSVRTDRCFTARFGMPPALGDPIWIVSFPWGRNMMVVSGIVSQLNVEEPGDTETASRLMVDASVSYGGSGGGVYEAGTGRLMGLVEGYRTARVSLKGDAESRYIDVPVPGETFVTPLALIRQFLTEAGYADLLGDERSGGETREVDAIHRVAPPLFRRPSGASRSGVSDPTHRVARRRAG